MKIIAAQTNFFSFLYRIIIISESFSAFKLHYLSQDMYYYVVYGMPSELVSLPRSSNQ